MGPPLMSDHRHYLDPNDMTPEERLDALAQVLAEGIIYLADRGQLEDFAAGKDTDGESGGRALTSGGNEGIRSCGARGATDDGETNRGEHGGG